MNKEKNKKNGKKRKLSQVENHIDKNKSYTDFLCPICLQILIEPVQLPCKHELCMQCFKSHVYETSLTCPMCRLRISIWVRKQTKSNRLVNKERWELIKSLFPERVQRRIDGGDDLDSSYSNYNAPKRMLANDGEVRKEYEEELKKLEEERAAKEKTSMEYIRKLEEEEQAAIRRQELLDQAAATELQKEEMQHLGVTLKSPSSHQRELLALLKPKSPMKLRDRTISPNSTQRRSSKSNKTLTFSSRTITSPNQTITHYFTKSNKSVNNQLIRTSSFSPHDSSKENKGAIDDRIDTDKIIDTDYEFAKQLQQHFNEERNGNSTHDHDKPFQTH